jgi:hypothetical protein
MTETTGQRSEAQCRAAARAEQITRQRRAAALLGKMLDYAAIQGLPSIAWSVDCAGAGLAGRCEAYPMAQRRADFNAWRLAVGAWAHQDADVQRIQAGSGAAVRLVDQWDRIERVTVTVSADLWAEI